MTLDGGGHTITEATDRPSSASDGHATPTMTGSEPSSIPIAVFAHNEADHIVACLESLRDGAGERSIEAYVLANGCTDRTEETVREYARGRSGIHLVSIPLGDKANAWNVYVHDIAPDRPVHVFIDGDVEATPQALLELHRALESHPEAHAAAGFPCVGRSLRKARRLMLEEHALAGNLYALSGAFLDRVRRERVRLPVGLVREDGLVGSLAKWNLDPRDPWDKRRLVPCPAATFRFQTLSFLRPGDWRLQWKRRIRYSVGYFETQMLAPILKAEGIQGMPADVHELYARSGAAFRHDGRGLEGLFRLIALARIKRRLAFRQASEARQD